ncbi:2-oxo acid dehydrogenase subunit E2 [Ralstonia solanacearum]|uniref:dihydrolipoamide acetyltransferase family protein n=1 Tax=Ralstonia solanacearum TaxID=305 RepID=UPI002306C015|nr:dihydrolipoamide acetyltransferase family protein [Ralstonia solanacearum]MDB0509601.1 2-oxo acid dehydrogenase subunit E2 [Ralstonia solanacearum]MDB0515533.1 2-oxo acid dehydrogenase subunit E2 [Ralstonia solanacearum]
MIEFTLPSLGADMDEGTLLEWRVKPGDGVKKGQIIAVVDTSKAAIDVESWHEGTVAELLVEPGAKIPVGTPMATFFEPGEASGTLAHRHAEPMAPAAARPGPERRRMVSPAARKAAGAHGIDVDAIAGTGPGGAVALADVERAVQAGTAAPDNRSADIRKAIAAAMTRSKREIPHYYVAETIPLTALLAWLARENASRALVDRLLPAVVLLKAVALALARFPELNGFYRDGALEAVRAVHIGVAISLRQGGLMAPALLDAHAKPLTQLMRELADLVKRCRAGSLKSSEMSAPTITVTNLGDQGAAQVFGIIYPPQVALVGFGRIVEQPWAESGGLKVVPAVTASLSADHRVSDGHRGALFLAELCELLQHPEALDR